MAWRAPTGFSTAAVDLRPREPILASPIDTMWDDQQFVNQKNEMVIGDQFTDVNDTTAPGWVTFRQYYVRGVNRCGQGGTTVACEFSLLAWSSDATDFDIAVYHNGTATRYTYAVTANHTSKIWRAWTACTLYSNGNENELFIQMNNKNSPSTPYLHLGGVAIFTNA